MLKAIYGLFRVIVKIIVLFYSIMHINLMNESYKEQNLCDLIYHGIMEILTFIILICW